MSMPIDTVRRWFKGDRWIPWTFVGMFAIIVIANGTMMFFAFDSWTGLSTNDSYKRGLVYNESLAKQETQARLGWKIASGFRPSGRLAGEIRVKLTDRTGSPLGGAKVVAKITAQDRAKKVIVFKMKRRKNYRRKRGHRQPFTELRIQSVSA